MASLAHYTDAGESAIITVKRRVEYYYKKFYWVTCGNGL